jgi:hypothetical protein
MCFAQVDATDARNKQKLAEKKTDVILTKQNGSAMRGGQSA